ncbi:LPS-assembly protein LptD [Psychromarinibacter halotolerans]|uniref:LPS-assembly protein LptD n=1 Tax=Psychromarinibacter halotolerans TaxID=1775175 RepID=A0ABV7GR39_9RHOB|nr:LPS assembly protein LptD [Psychromarinibacter halotolerans]MDF0595124.1 LPS assembly protein LptD [Psychromarinibacter halotolerans]
MRRNFRRLGRPIAGLLLAGWFMVQPLQTAQAQMATLIADNVSFNGADTVQASGNVEIFFEGQRLLAERLVYDETADELQIFGPITLIESSGQVVTATFAELSGDLKDGIMRGARVVLEEQMQVAAAELERVEGRYTQLYKAVASSCQVCASNPVPLWQIRAERVVHDQEERQLYFDNATFEVAGIPVLWLPRMRLPDPTLRRATGFLIPTLRQNSQLGFGVRVPYFVTLGDHADLTFAPFVSEATKTVEARFRRAFRWGDIVLNGAVSRDDILQDETRAYLFGRGRANLPGDFTLRFDIELVSDNAYLETYDYSDADRLSNGVEITRTRRNEYISAGIETLRTLRDSEVPIEETLATNLIRGTYIRRLPRVLGGQATLAFDVQGYEREAESVSADLEAACTDAGLTDAECLSRDVLRSTVQLGWFRDWLLPNGMIARADLGVASDFYIVGQDDGYDNRLYRLTPAAAAELRWPMGRTAANGGRDIVQPVVQLAWSESYGDAVPVEDSSLVEFDEGNLLALSRFPGHDARETGLRATVGFAWTHFTPTGREYALSMGRVFRTEDPGVFGGASGLEGATSDWLVASRVEISDRLSLTNRSLFDDTLDFTKSESRLVWFGRKVTATTSYIWVEAAASEGRTDDVSEWTMALGYEFDRHWTGNLGYSYDFVSNSPAEANVGLAYRNECVSVALSLSRKFTSSTNVEPATDVGLTVALAGFGQDGRPYARTCTEVKG